MRKYNADTRVIAIDFDGTITMTDEFPNVGRPRWGVIKAAIKERENGACLVLWTCREGETLKKAVDACKKWGLEFDYVNENPEFRTRKYGVNCRKVGADEYWDDRAVNPTILG